jgi:hypothetical protein
MGKKNKWGLVKAKRRSIRIRNDERTSLEKAQEQKKQEDLEDVYMKGKNRKPDKLSTSKHLINVCLVVGVDLGDKEEVVEENFGACIEFDKGRSKDGICIHEVSEQFDLMNVGNNGIVSTMVAKKDNCLAKGDSKGK